MRIAPLALLGCLAALPAAAQGYYQAPPYGYAAPPAYGYAQPAPDGWASARDEWRHARRAEEIARWRAANGDYDGADRAQSWADRHRDRARQEADAARDRW